MDAIAKYEEILIQAKKNGVSMVPRRVFAAERVCGGGVEAGGEGF